MYTPTTSSTTSALQLTHIHTLFLSAYLLHTLLLPAGIHNCCCCWRYCYCCAATATTAAGAATAGIATFTTAAGAAISEGWRCTDSRCNAWCANCWCWCGCSSASADWCCLYFCWRWILQVQGGLLPALMAVLLLSMNTSHTQ
jgi:hypothetical protein